MADLAVVTGGKFISEDLGLKLENVELEQTRQAKRITVDKDNTLIVEGAGKRKEIEARAEQIRQQIEKPPAITIAKSSRNAWPSWSAASPSSRPARPPKPK
jgi:chaperonin GroEL (HSP60 family)